MNFGMYGILIIFGAFTLLLILNPKLSCFGKRLKSPLYPVLRKRTSTKHRPVVTEDYGFDLGGGKFQKEDAAGPDSKPRKNVQAEDYGFNLDGDSPKKDA